MKKRKRPELKIRNHYMLIGGHLEPITPIKTDLPDRCKLAWLEMVTGQKHEINNENVTKFDEYTSIKQIKDIEKSGE